MIELRDYQLDIAKKAAQKLTEYKLACLAMEVRTGKTLTALHAADLYGAKSVLVMTKLKAIKSIEGDYVALLPSYNIAIINYEQMDRINPSDYDLIIIDEIQNFGAFPKPSGRMIKARKICAGKPCIFLSGTFSPESYSQLFHELAISSFGPYNYFLQDKKWGFKYGFYRWAKSGYVAIIKKKIRAGLEVDDYSKANGDVIWKDIKHLFIMFTQEEAGFEAPVEEIFLSVDMMPETLRILKTIENDRIYKSKVQSSGREIVCTVNSGADLINKMAQVSSGTLIFDDEKTGAIIDWTKAQYIREYFFGKKIAIFYRFKAELTLLKQFFPSHTESPEEFNSRTDLTFLGQVQSAREGVNLSSADALVMYNIDFSATSYFQARARIQSKERKGSAPLYWIFSKSGIEAKIYKAVSNKKNFTYSYYSQNVRKQNTGKDQKRIGDHGVVGVAASSR